MRFERRHHPDINLNDDTHFSTKFLISLSVSLTLVGTVRLHCMPS